MPIAKDTPVIVHKNTPNEYNATFLYDYGNGKYVVLRGDERIRVNASDVTVNQISDDPFTDTPKEKKGQFWKDLLMSLIPALVTGIFTKNKK